MGRLGAGPRLAAGVSGGAHSLALALLAQRWARERGGDLLALIVDHGLRAESAAEARHVAGLLAGRGIAARILALGLAPGTRLQERARAARFAALAEAAARDGRPWLLLGHHRADQAETLLFRALRGSGPDGLAAMAGARDAGAVLVLRPLLGVAPDALEAVVAAAGLAPVRDPSNRDPRFARIRLRDALGDPGGTGPGIAALAAAAGAFAARRGRVQAAMAERLALAAEIRPEGFAWIDPAALGRDGTAVAALAWLAARIGGAAWRPAPDRAAALLAAGQGTLAGAWLRPAAGGRWLLARDPGAIGPPVEAIHGAVWDGRFRLAGPGRAGFGLGALGAERVAGDARLPASVRRALPAIRAPNGVLAAVPSLLYPSREACAPFATVFAPRLAGGEFSVGPFKGGQPDLMCNREGREEYPSGMETDTRT
ncbi:tRNA lysidine(34) synthetase TilS [Roseomonas sp. PWR1]|uniref:tRNA(Ile)-lysidine synthase n=1 Tax=Roseomonas nitratireducens TaxID=2820810 RepID=A0ABS4AZ85_9PROT|nr:tRNA lysidine(34) synthetase TilS [Neoroseomonas nitratireducens]MBP0466123.1 tRNA lysidine(34) synthetase TilS [Neoroseomonas nitratireducens]